MCPPVTIMFVTNSMLLWWTSDSELPPLVIKPKVLCNYSLLLNDTFVRRTTDLEKTVNMN